MNEQSKTTIAVRRGTKRRLYDLGDMGESYDDVISRLLDELMKYRKQKTKEED